MSDSSDKWQIAFWVIAYLVIGSFSWTTFCAYRNQNHIESLSDRFMALKEVSNDCLHKIDLRLSRIESKLNIEVKNP